MARGAVYLRKLAEKKLQDERQAAAKHAKKMNIEQYMKWVKIEFEYDGGYGRLFPVRAVIGINTNEVEVMEMECSLRNQLPAEEQAIEIAWDWYNNKPLRNATCTRIHSSSSSLSLVSAR